ncbi:MAG: T9SS type A sorting domain-containing protein, partial [Ignavibacteria bacterium]|nr:T9SS type A sorting domain-containing protein [Ignavibacteria bacterium]
GNGGYAVTQINANDYATSLILQDNGKILVGGGSGPEDFVSDIILLRYEEDGNLDLTFGTNGYTISKIDSSKSFIQSIFLQHDGKIVAGGGAWSTTYSDFALARYTSDGILDTTFGRNGIILTSIDTSGNPTERINSIALHTDGKIVAAGYSGYAADRGSLVVARYDGGTKIISNYYLSWLDARSGTGNNIYSQKLDNGGEAKWTPNGNFVSDKPVLQASLNSHQLLFNGREFLSVFQGNGGIYAQSISENGSLNWGNDGVHVSEISAPLTVVKSGNTANQSGAILTFSGTGNPIGTGSNVYAKRINPDGSLGVITSLQEENDLQLNAYSLYQNYPNPFNPSTKIRYTIPNGVEVSIVQLKVYDVLGNEVATLLNEEKAAGSYEVSFSASNLASGIYFYRLTAGNFIETKKMILIK